MSYSIDLRPAHRHGEHSVNHTNSQRTILGQQTPIIGYLSYTFFVPTTILPGGGSTNQPLPNQLLPCPNYHSQRPTFSSGGQTLLQHSLPMNSSLAHPRAPIAPTPVVEEVLRPSENSGLQVRQEPVITTSMSPSQNLAPCQATPSIDIFVPSRQTNASRSPTQAIESSERIEVLTEESLSCSSDEPESQQATESSEENEVIGSPAPPLSGEGAGQARESSEENDLMGSPASVSSSSCEHAGQEASETSEQHEIMESTSSLSPSERAAISLNHTRWLEESVMYTAGAETFPMRLHRLLADLELTDGGTSIAAFAPDGRSFLIKDKRKLISTVLPKFFPKMTTYASFQRQLNLYNFKRKGGLGRNRSSYRHQFFIRTSPAMSILMKPLKLKRGPAFFSNKKYPPRKLRANTQPRSSTEEE